MDRTDAERAIDTIRSLLHRRRVTVEVSTRLGKLPTTKEAAWELLRKFNHVLSAHEEAGMYELSDSDGDEVSVWTYDDRLVILI